MSVSHPIYVFINNIIINKYISFDLLISRIIQCMYRDNKGTAINL